MSYQSLKNLFIGLIMLASAAGCNMPVRPGSPSAGDGSISDMPITQPLPALNMTIINFQAEVPGDTPEEEVFLTVVDEVTGLGLNPTSFSMKGIPAPSPGAKRQYLVSLPVTIGSVITYRYEHQTPSGRVSEHLADGRQVRYRIYIADGPGTVRDIISRWTDTAYQGPSGRITGKAVDAATGDPLANILISAGGSQVITSADGTFRIDGLPEGIHNLAAFAIDGTYHSFQQGARLAADSTTEAVLQLESASMVKGIFIVQAPEGTPPVVPLRLAGSLFQLGNTFGNLTGGVSSSVTAMPHLTLQPGGKYMLTINLPAGADIRYKYTLGDGFWNAEHNRDGGFKLRQLVVPNKDFLLEEKIESWFSGSQNTLTFDVTVPPETPANEFVSIQLNPLFGWTEPIPMWPLGVTRWAYILYSPLNLPGNLSYRFCRNNQCGTADDILTPGIYGQGRPVQDTGEPQTITIQVTEWLNLPWTSNPYLISEAAIAPKTSEFWRGFEHLAGFHPSWKAVMPQSLESMQTAGANWLVLSPTWTFNQPNPGSNFPLLDPIPGQDMIETDLKETISQARQQNLNVAVFPSAVFPLPAEEWWQSAARDETWWTVWFEQISRFMLNQAEIAEINGATAMILGGEWLEPALPGGTLNDGTPSNTPPNTETLWRNLIEAVRTRYHGKVIWALPYTDRSPAFLDAVDAIYVLYDVSPELNDAALQGADLESEFGQQLDNTILTLYTLENKTLILGFSSPADPDAEGQFKTYQAMLRAVNERAWITGFVSRGFFPPVPLNDQSLSVYGKPTMDLMKYWYSGWAGN